MIQPRGYHNHIERIEGSAYAPEPDPMHFGTAEEMLAHFILRSCDGVPHLPDAQRRDEVWKTPVGHAINATGDGFEPVAA